MRSLRGRWCSSSPSRIEAADLASTRIPNYLICMRKEGQDKGEADFREGLRFLKRHRPDLAVRSLRASAAACPASRSAELSARLYWLTLALLRLGQCDLALKSLASAQKLRPRGRMRDMYRRWINDYGMPRRATPELNDFYAFYSIHIGAYLGRKERPRFDSVVEKDAVLRIVLDSWLALSRSGRLAGLGIGEKLRLLKDWRVPFPAFGLGVGDCPQILQVDFRAQKKLEGDDRCKCGSGLPYRQCCGRTSSLRELSCE